MSHATDEQVDRELDPILQNYPPRRESMIPLLQDVQEQLGYLPREAMQRVAEHVNVPVSDIYGVATFYTQFHLQPQGQHRVHVCQGTACHVRGGDRILDAVTDKLDIEPGETTPDRQFTLQRVACVGSCALAPVVMVDGEAHGRMTPQKTVSLLEQLE